MSYQMREKVLSTIDQAKSVIYGQDQMLEAIIAALVCEGHLLIEGMPGLGKTLSVSTISKLCDLSFNRIQFTPDLLPSDLVGTMIYSHQTEEFTTKFGPIFAQLLLADEINRSPAKVQSALLEAMQEKQVTIGEESHKLSPPFVVLATQNPIDQEGTYPLPEAQMDRFMMKVSIGYPNYDAERDILDQQKNPIDQIIPFLSTDDFIKIQEEVDSVYVDEKIKDFIVKIVQATRPESVTFDKRFQGVILAGASPRACIWLHKLSKFFAYLDGKDYVSPEQVMKIVPRVLGHRIILSYEATIDQYKSGDVAYKIAQALI